MTLQVSDIISSIATGYYAPLATTLPVETLAVGAAWPGGWVKFGYTSSPLKVAYKLDTLDYEIEESLMPVNRRLQGEEASFEVTLAELTADALALAMDGTKSSTAQYEKVTFGGKRVLTARMFGFEGNYIDEDGANFALRCFIYKGTAVAGGELEFSKKAVVGVPFKVEALADLTRAVNDQAWNVTRAIEP